MPLGDGTRLPSNVNLDGRALRFTIELVLRFKKDFTCHPRKYVVVCDSSFEHTTYFQFNHVALTPHSLACFNNNSRSRTQTGTTEFFEGFEIVS